MQCQTILCRIDVSPSDLSRSSADCKLEVSSHRYPSSCVFKQRSCVSFLPTPARASLLKSLISLKTTRLMARHFSSTWHKPEEVLFFVPYLPFMAPSKSQDQKQNIHCGRILEFTITNRDISLVHFSRSFRGCFSVVSTPTPASQASFFRIVQELHVCA